MKRWNHLIEKVDVEMCKKAIKDAAKDKSYRQIVKRALNDLDSHANQLCDMIRNNTFTPTPYKIAYKKERGKVRKLCKPIYWPDQCVHHVLVLLIQKKAEKRVDKYAIASMPGKGQKAGYDALKKWILVKRKPFLNRDKQKVNNSKYAIKGDIRKCFESLKPDVIMREMSKIIKDKIYLSILSKIIYSYDSLPLGNYLSAWILNLILKPFDEKIRSQSCVKHYLRYMDDFIILSPNKRELCKLFPILEEELAKLDLELKTTTQYFSTSKRGIDMLGYRYFRKTVILRKRNYKNIRSQAKSLKKKLIYRVADSQSFLSRLGLLRHCNSKKYYNKYIHGISIRKLKEVASANSKFEAGRPYPPKIVLLRSKPKKILF